MRASARRDRPGGPPPSCRAARCRRASAPRPGPRGGALSLSHRHIPQWPAGDEGDGLSRCRRNRAARRGGRHRCGRGPVRDGDHWRQRRFLRLRAAGCPRERPECRRLHRCGCANGRAECRDARQCDGRPDPDRREHLRQCPDRPDLGDVALRIADAGPGPHDRAGRHLRACCCRGHQRRGGPWAGRDRRLHPRPERHDADTFVVATPTGQALTVDQPITLSAGGALGLLSGGALQINADIAVNGAGSVALGTGSRTVWIPQVAPPQRSRTMPLATERRSASAMPTARRQRPP